MVVILISASQPFSCCCSPLIHLWHLSWEALIKMVQIMEKHNKTFLKETLWTTSSVFTNTQWSMDCYWGNSHLGPAAHLYNRCGIHKVPAQFSTQSCCYFSHLQFLVLPYLPLFFSSSVPMLIYLYYTLSQKHSSASLPPSSPGKCLFIFQD